MESRFKKSGWDAARGSAGAGLAALVVLAAGCSNTKFSRFSATTGTRGKTTGVANAISSLTGFTVTRISVGVDPNAAPGAQIITTGPITANSIPVDLFLDSSVSGGVAFSTVCSTDPAAGHPCACQFIWNEQNSSNGSGTITIPRQVQTSLTLTQSSVAVCNAPPGYTSIPSGTSIKVTVVPSTGNPSTFTMTNYAFVIGQDSQTKNFAANQGSALVNILRYSCYQQRQRGMSIQSLKKIAPDPYGSGLQVPYYLANKFCFRKADGTASAGSGCETLPPVDFTSQANYFSMYIRDSESGDINPGNSSFVCPLVAEALNAQAGNLGTQGKYWPLDSSFALSLGRTPNFPVGILAHTKTSNPNDPTANNTDCNGSSSGQPSSANSLVTSCLGFAAQANTDGTCPVITDPITNAQTPTYRLRRFYTLYPQIFDTSGESTGAPQQVDTIYVLDRPVNGGSAGTFTMLGPKPCPFSYYDHAAVVPAGGGNPGYWATNNAGWTGTNVDGIQLPNTDSANSCSALLPIVNDAQTLVTLTTINASNQNPKYRQRYIRPVNAWAPHYEEDLSFQACAPLANPLRDPPLHFAKNPISGNVAWCAEAYPTQNDNVAYLDVHKAGGVTTTDPSQPYSGTVKPFTSHTSKYTTSPACTATRGLPTIPSLYPADGVAHHLNDPQTCDRTVVNPPNGASWARFPLLAPAADVEAALQADESYDCTVTYDQTGAKTGALTPKTGCCGVATAVWSGVTAAPNNATTAHMEPTQAPATTACKMPQY